MVVRREKEAGQGALSAKRKGTGRQRFQNPSQPMMALHAKGADPRKSNQLTSPPVVMKQNSSSSHQPYRSRRRRRSRLDRQQQRPMGTQNHPPWRRGMMTSWHLLRMRRNFRQGIKRMLLSPRRRQSAKATPVGRRPPSQSGAARRGGREQCELPGLEGKGGLEELTLPTFYFFKTNLIVYVMLVYPVQMSVRGSLHLAAADWRL